MDQKRPKVVVIGLDGADFRTIDPLMAEGRLPHLASLMKAGTSGRLRSTVMPNSFPAWTSCITGVNPGKHGIFWALVRRGGAAFPLRLMSGADIRVKRLWDILGAEGRRVGVVNVPVEYPPSEVNGFLVCGALTPGPDCAFTYPPGLREEVFEAAPGYACEIDYADMNLGRLARQTLRSIADREKLILYLLERKEWDLFFAVFTESDLVQHKYWAGIDPRHPEHARFRRRFGTFVHDVYRRLDEAVGRILDAIPAGACVLVVSDHGFGPFYQSFSVPRWLEKNGYLALEAPSAGARLKRLVSGTLGARGTLPLKRLAASLRSLSKRSRSVRSQRERDASSGARAGRSISWAKTRAYFTADFGIRLNLKGREPCGIVEPGPESEALVREMAEKLKPLKYSNGEPVFETVLTKEEAFTGPSVPDAPDLVVPINHAEAPPALEKWDFALTHPTLTGTHAPDGVLIVRGPGIKAGAVIAGAQIVDLTPTVLYLFGVPLTEDMDGKVLQDLFLAGAGTRPDITRRGTSFRPGPEGLDPASEEGRRVRERLRGLGYIE
jgi:predicted AlkP superfamily phosphohydrolase/phosphomutase